MGYIEESYAIQKAMPMVTQIKGRFQNYKSLHSVLSTFANICNYVYRPTYHIVSYVVENQFTN